MAYFNLKLSSVEVRRLNRDAVEVRRLNRGAGDAYNDDKIHVFNSVVVSWLSVVYIRLDYKGIITYTK